VRQAQSIPNPKASPAGWLGSLPDTPHVETKLAFVFLLTHDARGRPQKNQG
jgi:hypothetical protein